MYCTHMSDFVIENRWVFFTKPEFLRSKKVLLDTVQVSNVLDYSRLFTLGNVNNDFKLK